MTYLIWEMLLCLLVAFLLGLLLGWWLGNRKLHDRLDRLEKKWRLKHQARRDELEACRAELEASREASPAAVDGTELDACRRQLEECRAELEERRRVRKAAAEPVGLLDADSPAAASPEDAAESAPVTVADVAPAQGPPAKDDLKKVEGIGPKIEGLLNAGGILTWAQLAAAEVSLLQSILDEAGPRYRVHDPSTWPRQARLAADGAWEGLEALQDRLKGGRET